MKNTVIFDLDGTLLYTLDDLRNSVNYALSKFGYEEKSLEEIRSFVGDGVSVLMKRSTPDGDKNPNFNSLLSSFKKHYAVHSTDCTYVYDGMTELLQKLKSEGYKLAIVTNKIQSAATPLCKAFFGDSIDITVGQREELKSKPAPDGVFEALRVLGSNADDCFYIGDSDVDVATAKNSGIDCICVTWGYRDRDVLEDLGASVFADNADGLYNIIKGNA